jgi:hypothetical protein
MTTHQIDARETDGALRSSSFSMLYSSTTQLPEMSMPLAPTMHPFLAGSRRRLFGPCCSHVALVRFSALKKLCTSLYVP